MLVEIVGFCVIQTGNVPLKESKYVKVPIEHPDGFGPYVGKVKVIGVREFGFMQYVVVDSIGFDNRLSDFMHFIVTWKFYTELVIPEMESVEIIFIEKTPYNVNFVVQTFMAYDPEVSV